MKRRRTGWIGIGVALWVFGLAWVEAAPAQTRYTIDDVMDKLIEMDKRLVRVETEMGNLKDRMTILEARVERIEGTMQAWMKETETNSQARMKEMETSLLTRMKETETNLLDRINRNTTTIWALFGALITLYVTILVIVLGIYKNVRPRLQEQPAGVLKEADWATTLEKVLEPLRKEIREIAEREERLEKRVLMQTS